MEPPFPTENTEPTELENEVLSETVRQLEEYFAGSRRKFDLPIKQEGTEFQKKVWAELCNVPYGDSISYNELAARIGKPQASRAVGNANGRNKICIVVPCHRIIRADGHTGGYAYGTEMKEFLLALEELG